MILNVDILTLYRAACAAPLVMLEQRVPPMLRRTRKSVVRPEQCCDGLGSPASVKRGWKRYSSLFVLRPMAMSNSVIAGTIIAAVVKL
jgi:hypothetical protein